MSGKFCFRHGPDPPSWSQLRIPMLACPCQRPLSITSPSLIVAVQSLNGQNIYNGCCTLHIETSPLTDLQVKFNNEKSWDFTNPNLPSGNAPQIATQVETADGILGAYNPNAAVGQYVCIIQVVSYCQSAARISFFYRCSLTFNTVQGHQRQDTVENHLVWEVLRSWIID